MQPTSVDFKVDFNFNGYIMIVLDSVPILLWDVDGTLADTEKDGHRVAMNRAFAEFGLAWDWDSALYGELLRVTGGKERIAYYIQQYHPDFKPPYALDTWIADLHRLKTTHYLAIVESGQLPLRPGVKRLLTAAYQAGWTQAIVTTTSLENVTTLVTQQLGATALEWFALIAAGDCVPAKKPAPDVYHYALAQLHCQPHQCLALEDSENGLQSAQGAGIPVLITLNDYTREQCFTGALCQIDHLGEPDQPFQVIQGHACLQQARYIDLTVLQCLFKPL